MSTVKEAHEQGRASIKRGGVDGDEFRYRLDHLEDCIHHLEGEVVSLKATGAMHGPKLMEIERELNLTQKELAALQGQGIAHSVRLDGIDRTLISLKDEVQAFHKTLKEEIGANRALLANHAAQGEAWQRKILFTGVTMLLGILATFISGFILKFVQ